MSFKRFINWLFKPVNDPMATIEENVAVIRNATAQSQNDHDGILCVLQKLGADGEETQSLVRKLGTQINETRVQVTSVDRDLTEKMFQMMTHMDAQFKAEEKRHIEILAKQQETADRCASEVAGVVQELSTFCVNAFDQQTKQSEAFAGALSALIVDDGQAVFLKLCAKLDAIIQQIERLEVKYVQTDVGVIAKSEPKKCEAKKSQPKKSTAKQTAGKPQRAKNGRFQ